MLAVFTRLLLFWILALCGCATRFEECSAGNPGESCGDVAANAAADEDSEDEANRMATALLQHRLVDTGNSTENDAHNMSVDASLARKHPKAPKLLDYKNPVLDHDSNGTLYQFYVYRVQGPPPDYPPQNINVASLGGAMWYLHNEVVPACDGSGWMAEKSKNGDRKFGITRLRRFVITMKATQPLLDAGMNFGVLKSFDSAENTGPHVESTSWGKGTGKLSVKEWNTFGFNVGCGNLGEYPHADFRSGTHYPDAIWYSLPGSCPIAPYEEHNAECKLKYPGGKTDGYPTGQWDSTYHIQEAGEIDINELVGITPKWANRAEFCNDCGSEGGPHDGNKPRGHCYFNFWDNIWSDSDNAKRVEAAQRMFDEKYPKWPKSKDLPPPRCDFDKDAYGLAGRE